MAVKTIPAQTIKTCDVCGVVADKKNAHQEGQLTLKRHILDYQGHPCADGTASFDLCDRCLQKISTAINAVGKEAKGEPS